MKKRTIIIGMFILFLVGVISIIGTYAIDTTITEGNSSTADYLFNITLGDRTNREVVIPSYDSKIVDIKISNPNEFAMSYLLYIEGVNSNISVINIKDTEASGVLASKTVAIIQVFIQNNSNSDITIKIKDIVGFAKETLTLPSNSTSINKGSYYKAIVKSNNNTYGKVKPNIKLSTLNGILKYEIVPNTGYKYKSTTCNGTIENNTLTISNITSNINCEIVFEPIEVTVSFDTDGGEISTTYTEAQEHTYTVPYSGTYKLEVWGAQGGGNGGYGGYATGNIKLSRNQKIYINVGGQGQRIAGGYNGGGQGQYQAGATTNAAYGGGGATHIASQSGLLKSLSGNISSIYIVSGAGGGGSENSKQGGSGGGYLGNNGSGSCYIGKGGSQTAGGTAGDSDAKSGGFGYGGDAPYGSSTSGTYGAGGGGGGFYGGGGNSYEGGSNCAGGGAGGSGYIGNSQLTGKYMYCYNCTTSDEVNTKTYTTTNVSSSPISNYAKSGDGAAIITFLGEDTGAPVGTLTASKDYNNINVSINATDDMGIDHYEYYLSTSSTCPTEGYTISSSSSHKFDITETGTYYVCARVVDIAHNVLSLVSQPINYSRIYSVKVRYNVNGGTITPNTSTYTWTTDDTGLIYQNGNIYEQVIRHGTPADLADYNNSNFINITGDNLYVTSGNEWICLSGCSTANKIFNQTTKYNTSDFCDVTDDNCTVVLGVNFKRLTIPVFTYTGSYQIVDDNNNVISNTSTWTGNWKIRFLTDGTLTFTELKGAENGIDLFIVGGGGDGAQGSEYILNSRGGGGGGGGAAITVTKFPVEANVSYTIDIGAAKSNTSFKKGSTAYYTALAGSTPDRPSYTESGGWYVPIGAGGAGRLSGQTSKYGAASVIVKAGASGYSSSGNYEFNESSGKRYGAGGGCGSDGIAQSAGGWADAGAAGGSNGGGQGGAGCSYVNQGSGYETVGGYNGSAATANTGSGGGGGGGHCGYSATSTGGSGYGGSGGTGIIIIRNTR